MKKILLIFFLIILIVQCSDEKTESKNKIVNGAELKNLVEKALLGNSEANTRLSELVNSTTPTPDKANQLVVDSSVNLSGEKLFSVLMEYPNPVHNLLAVYNDRLNLLLLDNSLNGNIAGKWEIISGKLYFITSENFIVKDKLKLARLSLYSSEDEKVDLVFRTFTRFENSGKVYNQQIENVSSIAILTRLTSNTSSPFNNKSDTFRFNSDGNEYLSTSDTFTKFVLSEIKKANWEVEKPEIQPGSNEHGQENPETIIESNNDLEDLQKTFSISLNNDWEKPINIKVTNHLLSELQGIRYINEKLGSQITIMEIPSGSSSEQYVKYQFEMVPMEDYTIRATDIIKSGRNFIQFFEHSCSGKTLILLLQTSKYTYEEHKDIYNKITSSFKIEC